MNKKILIASIFAILMLLVPISSVVGVSDVEEDCGCQVVNKYDLFRVKLLLLRLKVFTNILLLRFGYIPEIAEKCQEILDVINSNKQLDFPIICAMLEPIWNQMINIIREIEDLLEEFKYNPIIANLIIFFLALPADFIFFIVGNLGVNFGCDWAPPP